MDTVLDDGGSLLVGERRKKQKRSRNISLVFSRLRTL